MSDNQVPQAAASGGDADARRPAPPTWEKVEERLAGLAQADEHAPDDAPTEVVEAAVVDGEHAPEEFGGEHAQATEQDDQAAPEAEWTDGEDDDTPTPVRGERRVSMEEAAAEEPAETAAEPDAIGQAEGEPEPEPEPESEPEPEPEPADQADDTPEPTEILPAAVGAAAGAEAASKPGAPKRISVKEPMEPTGEAALIDDDGPSTGETPPVKTRSRGMNDTRPIPVTRKGKPAKVKKRHTARWLVPLILILLLGGAYVGACYYFGDKVPRGTTVNGIAIGGLTHDAAVTKLQETLGSQAVQPVEVTVGDQTTHFDPVIGGLGFDAAATVDELTGLSFRPEDLLTQIQGLAGTDPVITVDPAALDAELASLATATQIKPVDATLSVASGKVVSTEASDGLTLDQPAARTLVLNNFLIVPGPWTLPTVVEPPVIGNDALQTAIDTMATPLLSGPVSVSVGGTVVEVPAAEIAAAATIKQTDGVLALSFDAAKLAESVRSRLPEGVLTPAEDAHFEIQDGVPVIVDGLPGQGVDGEGVAAGMVEAAVATTASGRVVTTQLAPTDPSEGRAELEALGVKEVIGEFHTTATNSVPRTKNLEKAAAIVSGMLVRPGEEFSLDTALGHRSAETGWYSAGVVIAGVSTEGIGGGLSQFSTTLYNASHLAGMVDVEHTPHSNYFSRYPTGREATIWEGEIDNVFRNDTPYGVVLSAWVTPELEVWVQLWSTKYWDVQAEIGEPYAYESPRTIHSSGAACKEQSAGGSGFQVDYWRIKTDPDGNEQPKETWHWAYAPMNAIICDDQHQTTETG